MFATTSGEKLAKLPLLTNSIHSPEWKQKILNAYALEMPWRNSVPKDEHREAYMAHIDAILSEFASEVRKYKAHDVSQNMTTLDSEPEWREDGMPLLPFQLRGTTDVLIELMDPRDPIETAEAPASPPMLQNTRVVLQIKKLPIAEYDQCVRQSMGELFATDVKAAAPVVAVLTDLVDD